MLWIALTIAWIVHRHPICLGGARRRRAAFDAQLAEAPEHSPEQAERLEHGLRRSDRILIAAEAAVLVAFVTAVALGLRIPREWYLLTDTATYLACALALCSLASALARVALAARSSWTLTAPGESTAAAARIRHTTLADYSSAFDRRGAITVAAVQLALFLIAALFVSPYSENPLPALVTGAFAALVCGAILIAQLAGRALVRRSVRASTAFEIFTADRARVDAVTAAFRSVFAIGLITCAFTALALSGTVHEALFAPAFLAVSILLIAFALGSPLWGDTRETMRALWREREASAC
ncbi:hypothetical protein [Gulosibacter sp. 10]|uniref:hypothetical protein n=1 Tax=Gulosibacter sp. 10 TaxID=1255570 RepID=UPI00097E91D2|nr:hypothetical protein [Gulosibacter sp. 10]SJM62875.1 hypothetical protein FM112_08825 [Gulosibacter sp. 10]